MKTGLKALTAVALIGVANVALGQALNDYLKVRNQYGIKQASSSASLSTFVGNRVVEVNGVVRGYLETAKGSLLVLEDADSQRELYVFAEECPGWLRSSNTSARLIVKATRKTENSGLDAQLVAAVSGAAMNLWEAEEFKKEQQRIAAAKKAEANRAKGSTTSRSSTRNSEFKIPANLPQLNGSARTGTTLSANYLAVLPDYAAFIKNRNKKLTNDQAQEIAYHVLAYSAHYGVDARLVMALVMCESGFDPGARSHAGAQGLGQLMPGTAKGLGVSNSYDTEENLYGTVKLLSQHMNTYSRRTGDDFEGLVLALAAYNAGAGAVKRHGGVPPYKETQNYVRKVIATYKQLIGE